MNILAIETSCDETSVALVSAEQSNRSYDFTVLAHTTLSQIDLHRPYGGVYPNVARREHQNNLVPLVAQALEKAGLLSDNLSPNLPNQLPACADRSVLSSILAREPELLAAMQDFLSQHARPDIDLICVTHGPGLEPALWVGVNAAQAFGQVWGIPVLPINHMEGHILSVFASGKQFSVPQTPSFPILSLLISGGHTELVLWQGWNQYQILGATRDDAVGEAFDKVARLLGLPYPGGPQIAQLTERYTPAVSVSLPRPMIHSGNLDFSFSGLKTAVRYLVESASQPLADEFKIAVAYEFQNAVSEVLVHKTKQAIIEYGCSTVIVGGGVAANIHIREAITDMGVQLGVTTLFPNAETSGDNALMIAVAGYLQAKHNPNLLSSNTTIRANGSLGF